MSIASALPRLASLSAAGNEYDTLSECPDLPSLTSINLERNDLTSINDVRVLERLDKLHTLKLKDNSIETIGFGMLTSITSLKNVDLAFNAVASWGFVDALNTVFPNLEVLRLSHNPLYEHVTGGEGKQFTADDGYMLSLARIGSLTRLNYSEVCSSYHGVMYMI